ncbi:ATP/GTP-binding protein [Nocardia stercoris]|uniref:ATP/GTP-binding protein n=1 Tax=Nocardia stercoris TaxID=2483361 RepID=A0A3M2L9E6_9NOCA|nr:ATP/GTP-binding protein [Nocardia stercoris]RMI32545.1 ATP/GTP-binding protein [Nocardia stercoris]
MPRRRPKRPNPRGDREPRPIGDVFGRTESGPGDDENYVVRTVSGARAVKTYRCPGCDHEIAPGTPHIVAWPADGGEDDRRHWHTGCWRGRRTRTITRRWS